MWGTGQDLLEMTPEINKTLETLVGFSQEHVRLKGELAVHSKNLGVDGMLNGT